MKGIFISAFSYVAALMGAGFASGQEIVTFFVVFEKFGIVGIALSALLIGIFGGLVSEYAMLTSTGYNQIISELMSQRCAGAIKLLTFVYSIAVIAVMLACFGELTAMLYSIPKLAGAGALALLCTFLLIKGSDAALKCNGIIGALLFLVTASVCLYLLGYREHQTFSNADKLIGATASGGIYAGYNLISVGAMLANGRVFLKKKGDGILCGAVSGMMIFTLLALMWGIMSIYYGKINLGELPMLTLTMRESSVLARIYALIITAAVLTTALSGGMSAVEYIEERTGNKRAVIFVMGTGLALSGAGFSGLIDTLYRYCGYLGVVAAFFVMLKTGNKLKNREKKCK